jgi:predicted transcriptional regulator of viral defense system
MATRKLHSPVWKLAEAQHGVVARRQLLDLGLTTAAIKHRLRRGRLHPIHRGVYAVGRPELTQKARWMAAVLACGSGAALSDESAAGLWGIQEVETRRPIHVTVPSKRRPKRRGIVVHRRALASADLAVRDRIPVMSPVRTLVHLADRLGPRHLEAAINEADKLGLVNPEKLRMALEQLSGESGVPRLRTVLDRHTFVLTDSELERRFLPLVRSAGLPAPLTGQRVTGFKVDFFWPDLGLVVETDGLRYHRTPAQQSRDRLRDQRHTAAGLTPLRFTHWQVARERRYVVATLKAVARRLRSASD